MNCELLRHKYLVVVLASFVSTWHSWSYHIERSFSWGNASMRSSCRAFSQLEIKGERPLVGGTISVLVVLGSMREQAEQASKEHPSMASASAPAFWPAWVSSPDFLGDEQQYGSVSWINPFLPNLLLGHDVCAGRESLTKTESMFLLNLFFFPHRGGILYSRDHRYSKTSLQELLGPNSPCSGTLVKQHRIYKSRVHRSNNCVWCPETLPSCQFKPSSRSNG